MARLSGISSSLASRLILGLATKYITRDVKDSCRNAIRSGNWKPQMVKRA